MAQADYRCTSSCQDCTQQHADMSTALAGMAASTAAWLAGTQLRAWDCCFFTLAELKGIWFLGAAGRWMVLPVGHLSPVWKALWRLAVQPLSALALPAGLQVGSWSMKLSSTAQQSSQCSCGH